MIGIFFFFDSRCFSFVSFIVSDFCSLIVLSHFHRSVVTNFFVFIFFVSFICTGNCSNPSMLEEQADLHFDISKKYILLLTHQFNNNMLIYLLCRNDSKMCWHTNGLVF